MNVFDILLLLIYTSGLLTGRMWQSLKDQAKRDTTQCPHCAITDSERRTALEISAIRRRGEAQMRRAAARSQSRYSGSNDQGGSP